MKEDLRLDSLLQDVPPLTDDDRTRMWRQVASRTVELDRRSWVKRRGNWKVQAALLSAAIVGVAAAATVTTADVSDDSAAECRSVNEGGSAIEGTFISQAAVVDGDALRADAATTVQEAVRVCALLWRDGLLQPGTTGLVRQESPTGMAAGGPFSVPPLQPCLSEDGYAVIVVGESSEACPQNGLGRIVGFE